MDGWLRAVVKRDDPCGAILRKGDVVSVRSVGDEIYQVQDPHNSERIWYVDADAVSIIRSNNG